MMLIWVFCVINSVAYKQRILGVIVFLLNCRRALVKATVSLTS
jgi:hypothetical protein